MISNEIYTGIVSHGYVDASAYFPLLRVGVGKRRHRGWVQIPVPATSATVTGPVREHRPAGSSGSSPLAIADERGRYPAAG